MLKLEEINQIWCDILGLDELKNDENFYDMGGNSLLLLLILNEVSKKYKYNLPTTDVYEYDTAQKMADCLEKNLTGGD